MAYPSAVDDTAEVLVGALLVGGVVALYLGKDWLVGVVLGLAWLLRAR